MTLELIAYHVAMSICHVLEFILGIFWEVWTCPRTLLKSSLNSTFQFQSWQTWGLTWTEQFKLIRKNYEIGSPTLVSLLVINWHTLEEPTFVWLTLVVESWKTHPTFFEILIVGSWARLFTWKTYSLKMMSTYTVFLKNRVVSVFTLTQWNNLIWDSL